MAEQKSKIYLHASITGEIPQYSKDISKFSLLTKEEEIELSIRIAEGDQEAYEKLINSNLRLVAHIARQYVNKCNLEYSDLIQEGNIGLMSAAKKFDSTKGAKFSTYASFMIKETIRRAIGADRNIHLSDRILTYIKRISNTKEILSAKLGRMPTSAEIADAMGITADRLSFFLQSANDSISLNAAFNDNDDNSELTDIYPDDKYLSPEEELINNWQRQEIKNMLSVVGDKRSKEMFIEYNGLDGGGGKTAAEMERKFHFPKGKVKKINEKISGKLKRTILSSNNEMEMEV
jgi:RNA polymerase primary sigma factor